MAKRRAYIRGTQWPVKFSVCVEQEIADAIEQEAADAVTGRAMILRAALRRGLPLIREARQRRERKNRTKAV